VNKDVGPLGAGGSGPLLTKTLLFIAQGAGGRGGRSGGGANFLRAFDKATGKVVAEIELPFIPFGSPMTYMAKGKQYIVLSLGDLRLAALSLP
jgi:quinoprotein glucose dehydrogenase